jgi:hypothetical protein
MPGTNGHAVHDAPEVHIQGALPILDVAQHAAATRVAALFMKRPISPNLA